jgi:saccharopine dehydrogenase-like NADP-dependent oxidoreductase
MAILGCGSAPGILNLMAVLAARGLDRVREIHCLVGSVDRSRYTSAPPLGFGYAPDTLLDEFTRDSAVFRAGSFRMVPPLDPRECVTVRFPAPVGQQLVHTTLHSEVATLPVSFASRGVREVTFRQAFEPEFLAKLQLLVRLGLAGDQPLRGAPGTTPRRVLLQLLRRFPPAKIVGRPQRYEVLRTVVRGTQHGRTVIRIADCHAGPRAGWGAGPDADTGTPPSIVAQLLLAGEIAMRPGVWPIEQAVPVNPFVRELARRGMPVRCRSTTASS